MAAMEAPRVLRPGMAARGSSGRLSIVQAAAIDDKEMGASALKMLVALGTYSDREGWCWPKQRVLAERLGVAQQAVSKALRDLARLGYIEAHAQYDANTGARISSRYRIVLDFELPEERRRTPQREVVGGSQLQVVAPTTSEVVAPTTSEVVATKEERPKRTTQKERPKKSRSKERVQKGPSAGAVVIDLVREGGAPNPTFTGRDGKALKDSGAPPELVAAAYLAAWHGDWDPGGTGYLRDNLSVHAVVDRLAGYQAWRIEQGDAPRENGSAPKLQPASDADRALWMQALDGLRGMMTPANFTSFIEPLTVAGRGADGGLRILVPTGLAGDSIKRFRSTIVRELADAGEQFPSNLGFVARRTTP